MDQAELKRLLHYDPATGVFTWLVTLSVRGAAGTTAGYLQPNGYVRIGIAGKNYQAHRLAWLYVHGVWPTGDIDHINTVRHDNRIANLRDATRTENMQNHHRAHANSSTGLLGASRRSDGRFMAQIRVNGKRIHLGSFDTPEEAHDAYLKAKQVHHIGGR